MSKRATTKNTDESDASRAVYVYCVGERDSLAPLFDEESPGAIESESDLELVGEGVLAAVVSGVPLADYGEGELPSRLADATWTATRALRHERVVEHFARRAAVAPLRFGTIYLRREGVERMLSERGAQFLSILKRLEGREEWGLNVRSEEHTSELQSRSDLVCRLLLEKKKRPSQRRALSYAGEVAQAAA